MAEIARDKELRKLNKGVLPSVLGAGGYEPSGVQYEVDSKEAPATATANSTNTNNSVETNKAAAAAPASVSKKPTSSTTLTPLSSLSPAEKEQKIDAAIATLMKYRTAGDGGHALKLLLTFVKNVNDQPQEIK